MQGRRDIPLSERGRRQVASWRLPPESAGPAAWVSSPLRRAVETAGMLAGAAPTVEAALVEMDWGEWEGLTLDEIRGRHGADFARNEARGLDFRAPRGESPREVLERVQRWLSQLPARPAPVVAVTHLGVLRVLLAAATGWDMTGKPPVRLRGDTLHRFAVDAAGRVTIDECNVPLLAAQRAIAP